MQTARLAKATADVAVAEERLLYARSDLVRSRALFEGELVSRRALEESQEAGGSPAKGAGAARAEFAAVSAGDLALTAISLGSARSWPWPRRNGEARARLRHSRPGAGPRRSRAAEATRRDS